MRVNKNIDMILNRLAKLNIGSKLIVSFMLVAIIPILIQFFVSQKLMLAQLENIQNERMVTTYENIANSLENEKNSIYSDNIDYAHWSIMYSCIRGNDQNQFKKEFSTISSHQKNISLIYVIDNNGTIIYQNKEIPGFSAVYDSFMPQVGMGKEFATLAVLEGKPYIISFARVIDADGTGAQDGYLIFGKEFDERFLNRLPKGYDFYYDFIFNGRGLKGGAYEADFDRYIQGDEQPGMHKKNTWEQYFKIYDYNNRPIALLYLKDTSKLAEDAVSNVKDGMLSALIFTSIFAIFLIGEMKNIIMKPIYDLRQRVKELRGTDYSIAGGNGDEISHLTEEFEAMSNEIKKYSMDMDQKNKKLEFLVYRDDITGAFNKRYFRQVLRSSFEEAKNKTDSLSLLFIGIDRFKYYQELVGQDLASRTLRGIFGLLKEESGSECKVCFDGTDEFGIIMPGIEYKEALDMTSRIDKRIRESYFAGMDRLPKGHITISCGLASFPRDAQELNELVNAADDRLKRIKQHNQGKIGYFYSIFNNLQDDINENRKSMIYMSKAFLAVIDAMDEYTYTHTEGVVKYSTIIAEQMNLTEEEKDNVRIGALLHDIGKLELGREILNKKEALSKEEIVIIKQHPIFAANMLKNLDCFNGIVDMVKYHHERYDGKGYPEGLEGDQIPLGARIIAVADSFDAMTTTRAYRANSKSYQDAVEEIIACSGSQFDPNIVKAIVEYINNNGYDFLLA
ncbi:MAG: HD domain-containing phosphohydrolase [Caulobacteraceae bacterium]